ncbi:DNA polymerase III subunit beta [Anaeromicropila herbilytica]|uniref:Beta sliding clamp n=1 Tax=Anaeromicropila herbilytica TaxID=2785025 RepID=A0A7R7EH84_9FIRM|nr:DNA polymerase III subunit beta [Anaeromicropila herbilytica]BCN28707.1 DNA polymerase III subunit beta [Anaeromicropila herbilytica]
MRIVCPKVDLLNGVNIVLKAVPAKTTMPILECIVINASNNNIKLTANDMELGIETIVKGDISEAGVIAINAKIFSEIIRKLPDNDVIIETDSNYKSTIVCEKAKFNISGKSADEFPNLPTIEKGNPLILSQFTLKELIRQTVFSISDNENNKIMTGELFEVTGDELKVVSLDGHRISIRKIKLKDQYDDIKVIVPGKTLNEISKILSGEMDDEVRVYITDKHIVYEFNNTIVLSRLIEGEYYKISQMLSNDYETKVSINKKELLSCIDRATLLVKESDKKPIILNVLDNTIELKINSSIGSMNEEIDIRKEGKEILIGFNPKFLIDALRVIDDEEIDIYLFNPKAPCFIKDKDENYIYLILPVNINASAS